MIQLEIASPKKWPYEDMGVPGFLWGSPRRGGICFFFENGGSHLPWGKNIAYMEPSPLRFPKTGRLSYKV